MLNVICYNKQKIDFLENYDGFDYLNYLLVLDEKIIGIITYIEDAEITDLFYLKIKDEFQNNGYGHYLLQKTLTLLKTKKVMLEVNENNYHAIKLYQKNNFKQISIRKKYYDEADALIFEWRK